MKRLESMLPATDPHDITAWYHGSPAVLTELAAGSTITPDRSLAEVFSHKPTVVSIGDDGVIEHDGVMPGRLYRISEQPSPEEVEIHPRTSMIHGLEWIISKTVAVRLVAYVPLDESERLSAETLRKIRERM